MAIPNQDLMREANKAAAARYRERNRAKINERQKEWRKNNLERSREMSRSYRGRLMSTMTPEQVLAFRASENAKQKKQYQKIKDAVFSAYGGYICKCCNETEKAFLSIDHIFNDGHIHRKAGTYNGNGTGFYGWLYKNQFPGGFQVLCMNCQFGKKKHGICPHQVRRNDYGESQYTQVSGSAQLPE